MKRKQCTERITKELFKGNNKVKEDNTQEGAGQRQDEDRVALKSLEMNKKKEKEEEDRKQKSCNL